MDGYGQTEMLPEELCGEGSVRLAWGESRRICTGGTAGGITRTLLSHKA